ncbi:MAG TPA: YaeQ family protein, partial [Verrucomicrobiae bacterium]|nr:YaeQ family protein [Verrucomicrobiae bacterium]
GEEPDIWVKSGDGRVSLWVEVGLPEAERLAKASRHAGRVVLLACGRALPRWREQHLPKLRGVPNLTVLSVEQAFLDRLTATVGRSIEWSMTITEGALYVTAGNETLETAISLE